MLNQAGNLYLFNLSGKKLGEIRRDLCGPVLKLYASPYQFKWTCWVNLPGSASDSERAQREGEKRRLLSTHLFLA